MTADPTTPDRTDTPADLAPPEEDSHAAAPEAAPSTAPGDTPGEADVAIGEPEPVPPVDWAARLGDPAARDALLAALGRPAEPDAYAITSRHPLTEPSIEVNRRLHAAGFTTAQAQLVYDLAAELVVPALEDVIGEAKAARMIDELQASFGGPDAWSRTAEQLRTWGTAHLDPETYAALASTPKGIHAMHALMRSQEPQLAAGGEPAAPLDQAALDAMVADPRYWRDRDPDFIARVSDGFARLYAR